MFSFFITNKVISQPLPPEDEPAVSFELKTSPDVDFVFDTFNKYITGITKANVLTLNVKVEDTQWDLYVGATTDAAGLWDEVIMYGSTGAHPPVSILQVRLRNASNTPWITTFFNLTDIGIPTYIIGTNAAPDDSYNCPEQGTNAQGTYISQPNCYKFDVDLKIVPGLTYKAGLYKLRVDYVLMQDL
jgi:hypothetical protein